LAQFLGLCAVPAVALAWFAPLSLSALAISTTPAGNPLTELDTPAIASASDATDLAAFEDTSLQTDLVKEARKQSKFLNDQVRALRKILLSKKPGSFDYGITLQQLTLINAERNAWDQNWRKIGRPGVDPIAIQNSLTDLQDSFVQANTDLKTLQAKEVSSGSISTYTPPAF